MLMVFAGSAAHAASRDDLQRADVAKVNAQYRMASQGLGMRLIATTPGPGVAFVTNDFGLTLEIMGQRVRGVLDNWLCGSSEDA